MLEKAIEKGHLHVSSGDDRVAASHFSERRDNTP
jgi:hypothetical protein